MATYKGVVPSGKYTFNAAAKTITFDSDYTGLALSDIMLITNVKSGTAITIYDPFDSTRGGVLSTLTLTLNYNTTAMSNTDPLQIIVGMVNLPTSLPTGAATETTLSSIDSKTPSLGQALAAGSVPVVLTANQLSTLTPLSSVSVSNFPATQPVSGNVSLLAGSNVIGSISNGSFGISGTLPAFGAIPTFKIDQTTPGTTNKVDIGTTGTVAISGSVAVTGPLTDTQLRASAVPVSLASLPSLAAGTNAIGSITNTAFGISGTLPAFASTPTFNVGTSGSLALDATLTGGTQKTKITDGTNDVAVKAASTAALAADKALVVAVSPNNSVAVTQATAANLNATVSLAASQTLATVTTVSTVTNLAQMAGTAITMNSGPRTAGTQRVTIATDDIVLASQSGTWTIQPGNTANTTPWLTRLSDGTNNVAIKAASTPAGVTDPALVVAISPNNSLSITGSVTANAGTSLNTSALALETGGNLATIKSNTDNLALTQGSTTSGQKGNLIMGAVTTSNPAYTTAQTSPLSLNTSGELRVGNDGTTVYRAVSAASNNTFNIKNSAGKVYGWYIYNSAAVIKKVLLYDKNTSSLPVIGVTAPLFSLIIPASSGANVSFTNGVNFTDGLYVATVGGPTPATTLLDTDSSSVSVGDLSYNIIYK